jgi:predicted RNA-binding Zn-ribbon protein involved in translation (DUF1610 family)
MADIVVYICTSCGADMSSVAKSDGTIYYCPECGMQYGGLPLNSADNTNTQG